MDITMQETDSGGVEWLTDARTIADAQFVITTTPTGMYKIEVRGVGASPKLTEERFTNLNLAKRAIELYLNEHAGELNKRAIIRQGIERRRKLNEDG